jgi:hypothetical protein
VLDVDLYHVDVVKRAPRRTGTCSLDACIESQHDDTFSGRILQLVVAVGAVCKTQLKQYKGTGNGYPQAALILEPKEFDQEPMALIEQVWLVVEEANKEAPAHA